MGMMSSETSTLWQELMQRYREIFYLNSIASTLNWDQEVMMPRDGAPQRAEELAALKKLTHERQTHPRIGELLSALVPDASWTDEQKADRREAQKSYEIATLVPGDLVAELARLEVLSTQSWSQARKQDDYSNYWPYLEQMVARRREYADAIRKEKTRYDALLDQFEPGETSAGIRDVFNRLRTPLRELLQQIQSIPHAVDSNRLEAQYPEDQQRSFGMVVIEKMGYDLNAGRLDISTHPFCTGTGGDVRITTRYDISNFTESLFGCMHEVGHALYEQGLVRERLGDPSMTAASLGIHESQSRLWENFIGRSRAFWQHFYPRLCEQFPLSLKHIPLEEFWRMINHVQTSFIRTEADEVTYNLHIILRFEIEQKLIDGSLSIRELPEFWNHQFQKDFGLTPATLREGCMQDIHWPAGIFGYFPTYALGNLYAAQFFRQMEQEIPVQQFLLEGQLLPIREWLREKIHRLGHTYSPRELCQRVTGRELSAQPLLDYLGQKYQAVYQF